MKTELENIIGIKYPIIQAPMAGGATTPELISCVSNCGGLGSLGAGYLSASQIQSELEKIQQLTQAPFAVNLFVPEPHSVTPVQMEKACASVSQCARELDIDFCPIDGPYAQPFEEQIQILIDEKVPIISFTFGIPHKKIIKELKAKKVFVIGTATTISEAIVLQENEFDAIVLQGSEAGGHRGSFLDKAERSLVPLIDLVNQSMRKIQTPIIASGGISDGEDIVNLMSTGVAAVQLGTAFLCCPEAGIPDCYKRILLDQKKDTTVLTRAFSGKLARGVGNRFSRCMETKCDSILDYPIQNKLTNFMRRKAKDLHNTDYMSLWSGQSVYKVRALDAKALLCSLVERSYSK